MTVWCQYCKSLPKEGKCFMNCFHNSGSVAAPNLFEPREDIPELAIEHAHSAKYPDCQRSCDNYNTSEGESCSMCRRNSSDFHSDLFIQIKETSHESEKSTCGNCRFQEDRKCHRNPPTIKTANGIYDFPMINLNSWCGEHRNAVKP